MPQEYSQTAKSVQSGQWLMPDKEGLSMIAENENDLDLRSRQAFGKARVLVVDDSLDIVRTCALLLRYSGFDVRTAINGRDALKVAVEFHPQIALLDVGLPDLDGYEVARTIRADRTLQAMTLIAITAYGNDENRRRAQAAGFDHYLVKPVQLYDLLALITVQP
jgi:two-component system, chemotaxis family, CheB/CheR fusion protein